MLKQRWRKVRITRVFPFLCFLLTVFHLFQCGSACKYMFCKYILQANTYFVFPLLTTLLHSDNVAVSILRKISFQKSLLFRKNKWCLTFICTELLNLSLCEWVFRLKAWYIRLVHCLGKSMHGGTYRSFLFQNVIFGTLIWSNHKHTS